MKIVGIIAVALAIVCLRRQPTSPTPSAWAAAKSLGHAAAERRPGTGHPAERRAGGARRRRIAAGDAGAAGRRGRPRPPPPPPPPRRACPGGWARSPASPPAWGSPRCCRISGLSEGFASLLLIAPAGRRRRPGRADAPRPAQRRRSRRCSTRARAASAPSPAATRRNPRPPIAREARIEPVMARRRRLSPRRRSPVRCPGLRRRRRSSSRRSCSSPACRRRTTAATARRSAT